MELVGIVLFIPLAFVAGGIYACVIHFVLRYRIVSRVALWASTAVLVGLLLEWVALITVGAVRSRAIIGPAFYPLHLLIFFLAIPAFANLLLIRIRNSAAKYGFGAWFVEALLCSALALPVVLTQYGVAEALYGIDGAGGPYGQAPTIPMPSWW